MTDEEVIEAARLEGFELGWYRIEFVAAQTAMNARNAITNVLTPRRRA